MKKHIVLFMLFSLAITACADPARPTEESAAPTDEATGSPADILIRRLSFNLGLEENEIALISREDAEFSDACLGIARFDTVCGQVVTPGYIFIFEANGIEYEYRTDMTGASIQPATLALTWTREGGIAGFCDRLMVYGSGEVFSSNCRSQPSQTSGTFAELLTATARKQFNTWYLKFGKTILDVSDPPGVSDRLENTLEFFGTGTGRIGETDRQALFDWALALFRKLNA